jgi:hypothetical protein
MQLFYSFLLLLLFSGGIVYSQCPESGYDNGNLVTCTTSYLGGANDDHVKTVRINGNMDIVLCGQFSDNPIAENYYEFFDSDEFSPHQLLIAEANTGNVKSLAYFPNAIDDIDVDRNDNSIYVLGSFGLAKLSHDGSTLLWHKTQNSIGQAPVNAIYSSGNRLAVGENGDVVVLGSTGSASACNAIVHVFNANGDYYGENFISIERSDIGGGTYNETWEDIAIDDENMRFFVTGKAQRCSNYQTSFLMAYSYASASYGEQLWKSFTLWCSGADNYNLTADARGKRVRFQNDELLFVGNADGGNNLFTKKVNDYETPEPNLESIDRWNQAAGFSSGKIGFFARINPDNGEVIKSQFQFSSLGINQPRSFEINSIVNTSIGDVIIGGSSEKDMPNRENLQINGLAVGDRVDNESALIGVNANFNQRNIIATFTGLVNADDSEIISIDYYNGLTAIVGETNGEILTYNALDNTYSGGSDVFVSTFGDEVNSKSDYSEPTEFMVYPNPSLDGVFVFQMPYKTAQNTISYCVYNAQGKVIKEGILSSGKNSISIQEKGVFWIKILLKDRHVVKKVVSF